MEGQWNAYISIKSNSHFDEAEMEKCLKSWNDVDKFWSTMGDWDCWIKLNDNIKTPAQIEDFVCKLRKQPWVGESSSHWWRAM